MIQFTIEVPLDYIVDQRDIDILQKLDGMYASGSLAYNVFRQIARFSLDGMVMMLHQHTWRLAGNTVPKGRSLDHINQDMGDNRLCNLQVATQSEQNKNKRHGRITLSTSTATTRHYDIVIPVKLDDDSADLAELVKRRAVSLVANNGLAATATYVTIDDKKQLIHQAVYRREHGSIPKGRTIDHINRNTGDNRIDNLRAATRQEQIANRSNSLDTQSGYFGVQWMKKNKKWIGRVQTRENGKPRSYPSRLFTDELDAAIYYDLSVRKYELSSTRNFTDEQLYSIIRRKGYKYNDGTDIR